MCASLSVPEYTSTESAFFVDRYGNLHDSRQVKRPIKQRVGGFCVIVAHGHILLNCPPWAPSWAELPGGGIDPTETVEAGALRELEEEVELRFEAGKQPKPYRGAQYYINLYAEDVQTYYRYTQLFSFYDLSDLIDLKQLSETGVSAEGSYRFWHPLDQLQNLPKRHDDGRQIDGLRVGHKEILSAL